MQQRGKQEPRHVRRWIVHVKDGHGDDTGAAKGAGTVVHHLHLQQVLVLRLVVQAACAHRHLSVVTVDEEGLAGVAADDEVRQLLPRVHVHSLHRRTHGGERRRVLVDRAGRGRHGRSLVDVDEGDGDGSQRLQLTIAHRSDERVHVGARLVVQDL